VLAARAGDTDAALQTWLDVYTADIVRPAWLEDNLVVLVFERLNENVQADRLDEASSALVERVMQTPLRHAALNPLLVAALDQMARQQAIEGAWQQAVLHWEAARQLVSSSSSLGSPRTLLHNLALAYEALEEWTAAAEMWRAMLRTRPRKQKKSDDVPLDYNDEQWAWVRQRVIECYRHAGEPGEAVKVFRQAIKSDPHDLDMRVQLADALRANEQDQASLNELHRILEIDPMHTETHLRLASIHTEYGHWIAAERSLRVVLDQQPEREDVRRQISQLLLTRGHHLHRVGLLDMAHDAFEEGRRFDPDNYRFPLNLARLAIDRNDRATADSLLAEVLAMADDEHEPYLFVIDCYTVLDDIEQARAVLARAEEQQSLSPTFYIQLSKLLLDHSTPAPPLSGLFGSAPEPATPIEGPWLTLALEAIDRAVALQPNDLQVRILLASELMTIYPDMALEHAQAAADLAPEEPSSLILLGLVQALNEQDKEAKATLRRAARLARQQGNMALAEQAEGIRQEVGSPFLRLRLQMQAMGDMFDEEDEDFFF
jgi:tetratricopeptide (TPR) repeat protein